MKKTILTLAFATCSIAAINAQTSATTDAVGYNTVSCLPNSDTIVSVPFLNTTDSISSTVAEDATPGDGPITLSGDDATFTIQGVTDLTADQYKDLYYVRFTSGAMEGNIYQITGNTTSAVTFNTLGDPITAVVGDKFSIYKFWTLGTLFPPADQTEFGASQPAGPIVKSSNNLGFNRRTEVLFPDFTGVGTNKAPAKIYFLTSEGWKNNADLGATEVEDTIIWPDGYLVISHPSMVSFSTTYRPVGTVDALDSIVIPLLTDDTVAQDNYVAIPRPIDVPLKDLGLIDTVTPANSAFVSSANNLGFNRRDEILLFDNATALKNKAPTKIYFHNGTNWIDNADLQIADDDIVEASAGIIIKKYPTENGNTVFWRNSPAYANSNN